MPSLAARLMPPVVRLMGIKRTYRHPVAMYRKIYERQLRPERYAPPKSIDRIVHCAIDYRDSWPIYEIVPRSVEPGARVLYLHGGGYISEITDMHWRFIAQLAAETASRVTIPIYPLAPLATAATVVPTVTGIAAELVAAAGPGNTTVMGDSAGGGMALATVMQLRDRGLPAPRTILISPWLDVAMTDPGIAPLERRDPMLAPVGLAAAGDAYRGTLPVRDPMVSPLFGDLRDLGPITMFCGTRDILVADARRLAARATQENVTLDYYEAPEMLHVYPLLPIPEAKQARALIAGALGRR